MRKSMMLSTRSSIPKDNLEESNFGVDTRKSLGLCPSGYERRKTARNMLIIKIKKKRIEESGHARSRTQKRKGQVAPPIHWPDS